MKAKTVIPERNGAVTEKKAERAVQITPPNLQVAEFRVVGTAPYCQNAFSAKAMEMMRATQEAGTQAKSKRKREPKNFDDCYEQAKHTSTEGWLGIPAASFRNALISACRLVGFKMTHAKLSAFILADGLDQASGQPLVKIEGEPKKMEHYVRLVSGVADIRARPVWFQWGATVRVRFDADQFSLLDITNLMARAGAQVGIGEGRPDSPNSTGQGWGTFEIEA